MKVDHINCPIRIRVELDNPEEPLEMVGFTIARYKFACKWMREDDRVIEIACGAGFGSHFFAKHVGEVHGIDADETTIARCRSKYQLPNLRYTVADILKPDLLAEESYDTVVAFELLEHFNKEDGITLIDRCLELTSPGGLCILSTPRIREDRSVSRRHHHLHEYDHAELHDLLRPRFARVMIFCQNDEYIYAGHPSTAWNFIAVCFA